MGAWSVDSFGNDDAADWLDELTERDLTFLQDSLHSVSELAESEYLEIPEASCAVAAAEIVAALRGFPTTKEIPEKAVRWISANKAKAGDELRDTALKSLERIRTNSELQEVWDDAELRDGWYAEIEDLENRLRRS